MKRRWKIAIAAIALVSIAFLAATRMLDPEPRYNGKSLKAWLYQFDRNEKGPKYDEAAGAIRAIGTNCIPYLLEYIQITSSKSEDNFRDSVTSLLQKLNTRWELRDSGFDVGNGAMCAFALLRPAADRAVPQLNQIFTNAANEDCARRSGWALATLPPIGVAALTAALTNSNAEVKQNAAWLFSYHAPSLGTNAAPAVPFLIADLREPNLATAFYASEALRILQIQPEAAVHELTKWLHSPDPERRKAAIGQLGLFGEPGTNAVPELLELLRDPDREVRRSAVYVLGRLPVKPQTVVPALIEHLTKYQNDFEATASTLSGFGEYALPAIPALQTFYTNESHYTRVYATSAVYQITRTNRFGR